MKFNSRYLPFISVLIIPVLLAIVEKIDSSKVLGSLPAYTAIGLVVIAMLVLLVMENSEIRNLRKHIRYFFMKTGVKKKGARVLIERLFIDNRELLNSYEFLAQECGYKEDEDADATIINPYIEERATLISNHEEREQRQVEKHEASYRELSEANMELRKEIHDIRIKNRDIESLEERRAQAIEQFVESLPGYVGSFITEVFEETPKGDQTRFLLNQIAELDFFPNRIKELTENIRARAQAVFDLQ
jgi:hypothetical protein